MDEEIRTMLLNQQMISQLSLVDNENPARYPAEIDTYHQLFPLENTDQKSATLNPIVTSTFRVNHRDGLQYCMKRIHGKIIHLAYNKLDYPLLSQVYL